MSVAACAGILLPIVLVYEECEQSELEVAMPYYKRTNRVDRTVRHFFDPVVKRRMCADCDDL